MNSRLILLIGLCLGAFVWLLSGCEPGAQHAQAQARLQPAQGRDSAYATLRADRRLLIVYPASADSAAAYRRWAAAYQQSSRFLEVAVIDDASVSDSMLQQQAVFLIGSYRDHLLLPAWERDLPVSFRRNAFTFLGETFADPNQVLLLSAWPHPLASKQLVAVLTGSQDADILAVLQDPSLGGWRGLPWTGWDYQVLTASGRRLMGRFANDWSLDSSTHWHFDAGSNPRIEREGLQVIGHQLGGADQLAPLADTLEQRRTRFLRDWQVAALPPLVVHTYDHPETMGLQRSDMQTAFREDAQVHQLLHPAFQDLDPGFEYAYWAESSWGPAAREVLLDGFRIWSVPVWMRKGWPVLAASLLHADGPVPLDTMLAAEAYERESDLVREAYAGAFVGFLMQHLGENRFPAFYRSLEADRGAMAGAWQQFQDSLMAAHPVNRLRQPSPLTYHKGMTFAHEGYQVFNGYGSRLAEASLSRLADIGCNAIAIVPYTGSRSPSEAHPFRWSFGAGGENDVSVVLAHHATQQRDMHTMLKPQVWVRGGWPGDLKMDSEAEWQAFFDHYHRWIRHYALMAEIHGMDILCIGTEFRNATMIAPRAWRDLIFRLRGIYHGAITYAANWGEETNALAFAEDLDFVGVNFYYPLSADTVAAEAELRASLEARLQELDQLSAGWGVPYVLTEIGYRPVDGTWLAPHADAGARKLNEAAQALCYRLVLETLPAHPRCQGLYWWKWPSFLAYPQENPRSFTPVGREAEQILRRAYQSY